MKWNLVVTVITDLHVDVDVTGGGSIGRGAGLASDLGRRAVGALLGEAHAVTTVGVVPVTLEPSRRCPELRKRDLRTEVVEGEGLVLVGHVLPGVLREELYLLELFSPIIFLHIRK